MATHILDIDKFRLQFPEFADPAKYPDATLQAFWDMATVTMGAEDGPLLCGPSLQLGLELMTAHMLKLLAIWQANGGGSSSGGGIQTGATIDKISVTFAAPPFKNGWDFYLSQSPYGSQLLFFLRAKSAGGFYVGGLPERRGFRKIGGVF